MRRYGDKLITSTSEVGLDSKMKHWDRAPETIAPELVSSRERSLIILGTPHGIPSTDSLARHAMFFVIRVLRSWTRMIAATHTSIFPPMIHHLQLKHGLPVRLASCYTLIKMWDDNKAAVSDLMIQEIKTIFHEV
jgi:hypothetical protein